MRSGIRGRALSPRWWSWAAPLSSILVCGAITWIHLQQEQITTRTVELVATFRRSQVDLAKGFLRSYLASESGLPLAQSKGLALLDGVASQMRRAVATGDPDETLDPQEAAALHRFAASSARLHAALAAGAGSSRPEVRAARSRESAAW